MIDIFISSKSLLNISCIFSILVSSLFICHSILFSRFLITFTITILNHFSGRLPISFVWFSGHLSCSFTCWIFLWLFILFRLLCLGWSFCILAVCGSSLLRRFLPVGGVGLVACQGFLVREACMFSGGWSWSSSPWNLVASSECWFAMGLVWLQEAYTLMLRSLFLHCWRISMIFLALGLVSSWVELGFCVSMEAFRWAVVDWISWESGVLW